MSGTVILAWYHNGYTDSPPRLIAVCSDRTVASREIKKHQKRRDRFFEYKDQATWWTAKRKVKVG